MSSAIVGAEAPTASPAQQMLQLSSGHIVAKSLSVVAELGIADLLSTGPYTSGALAAQTGVHARPSG